MGRFLTPDPYSGSISLANPASWNRYSYVGGDPINGLDPLGLCNAIIGGITQSSDGTFGAVATIGRADQIYPYAGGSVPGGVLDVATDAGIKTVYDGIMAAAKDPGPINIVAYSGGAGAFAAVIAQNLLPADVVGRIASVTYLSPGAAGDIPTGPWKTNIFLGNGAISFLAELATSWGEEPDTLQTFVHPTNCAHTDTACLIDAATRNATYNAIWDTSNQCSKPSVFSPDNTALGGPRTKVTPGFGFAYPTSGGGGGAQNSPGSPWDWSITHFFDWIMMPPPIIPYPWWL